jgi:hypothetical protein
MQVEHGGGSKSAHAKTGLCGTRRPTEESKVKTCSAREGCRTCRSFAFEDGPDISFSVENAKNVHAVLLQNVVNANGFKSSDRPRA